MCAQVWENVESIYFVDCQQPARAYLLNHFDTVELCVWDVFILSCSARAVKFAVVVVVVSSYNKRKS